MDQILDEILAEFNRIKPRESFHVGEYLTKLGISKEDKFKYYNEFINLISDKYAVDKKYENATIGLPQNIPIIKIK